MATDCLPSWNNTQAQTSCIARSPPRRAVSQQALQSEPMALKSTIFKATIKVADIDHSYYADHALTLARHPSETDERMMVRLAALAFNAHHLQDMCQGDGTLEFGPGLSDPEFPDASLTDFTGRRRLWIEVGQPDEKPLAKACGKADLVVVYSFHHAAEVWWRGLEAKLGRLDNLEIWRLPSAATQALALLASRSMQFDATIMEGELTLGNGEHNVHLAPLRWK